MSKTILTKDITQELCYAEGTQENQDDRKKAINSYRLESTVMLGIELYDRRKKVEERTVIARQ